jgi:hypothetical protein
MIRAPIAVRRISMPRQNNLNAHLLGPLHYLFEIVNFKPQQEAVPVWPLRAIADRAMIVFNFEAMQLQNQLSIFDQLLICLAPVRASASQQPLIPLAAGLYIRNGD